MFLLVEILLLVQLVLFVSFLLANDIALLLVELLLVVVRLLSGLTRQFLDLLLIFLNNRFLLVDLLLQGAGDFKHIVIVLSDVLLDALNIFLSVND